MAASATSWTRKPFNEGVPLSYQATYDSEQFARLKMGLIPREMEDKWFVYYDEPHLFFHRSWTGQPVYRLSMKSGPNGAKVTEALWAKDLAVRPSNWNLAESPMSDPDYQVRLLDFLVSNLLLGQAKPFPMPPGETEPMHGLIQAHVSGTGYPQSSSTSGSESLAEPKSRGGVSGRSCDVRAKSDSDSEESR